MKISKTLISKEEIENKISEIAETINSKYKDEELVVIGILKGAFIVVSDLAKQLKIDVTFDFMSIKSYYGSESSGQIKIIKDLEYDISNKNILITAGPTIEKIDPVRYISNHSSGKMGYALAEEALSLGANVSLISGPTNQSVSKEIELMKIETTDEMYKNTIKKFETSDVVKIGRATCRERV